MADLTLTKTRIYEGHWEGILTIAADSAYSPEIEVTYLEKAVPGVMLRPDDEGYAIRVPIPMAALADGVQTFLIRDLKTGNTLDSFTVITGEPLEHDIRAEIDLLRAELDMLKRAFRRHCVETT